jgi:hypothetical protein
MPLQFRVHNYFVDNIPITVAVRKPRRKPMIINDLNYAELLVADVIGAGTVSIHASGDVAVGEGFAKTSQTGATYEHGRSTTYKNKDSAKGAVKVVGGGFDLNIGSGL